jgi:hypothetical protein
MRSEAIWGPFLAFSAQVNFQETDPIQFKQPGLFDNPRTWRIQNSPQHNLR